MALCLIVTLDVEYGFLGFAAASFLRTCRQRRLVG
ncbi:hypothetical protein ABIB82_002506 [Bradyrhizobium sp. i1.8.4]